MKSARRDPRDCADRAAMSCGRGATFRARGALGNVRAVRAFMRAHGHVRARAYARGTLLVEERVSRPFSETSVDSIFVGRLGRASALMGFNGPRGGPSPLGFFQMFWVFRKRPTTLAPQVRGSGVPGR